MSKMVRVRSFMAGIMAFVFLVTNVMITDFAFARTTAVSAETALRSSLPNKKVSDPQSLSNLLQRLPQEFGFVKTIAIPDGRPANAAAGPTFVIHIQDAHANPGAQINIKNILEYLKERVDGLVIGVEGTAGPFHPEYFDVFPDFPDAGDAVIKDLLNKGELSGSELFAWNQYKTALGNKNQPSVQVNGLEIPELYRKSYDLYQRLASTRAAIQRAVEQLRSALVTEQSRMLNSELRDFLRERQRRKTGRFGTDRKGDGDLPAYLDYLGRLANGMLQIDLKNSIEQLRFPELNNFFRLKDTESQLDRVAAGKEWKEVLKLINANVSTDFEKALAQSLDVYGRTLKLLAEKSENALAAKEKPTSAKREEDPFYPRKLLEKLWFFAKNHKLDLSQYRQFGLSFRLQILQAEMVMDDLLPEIDLLESFMVERLAKTIDEKKFVKRLENFDLLEKLFGLELTPPEFVKVLRREEDILREAGNYRREIQKGVSLQEMLRTALEFYQLTRKRDGVLADRALKSMNEEGKAQRAKVMVIVTGGFHGDGIGTQLMRQGIPYAVIHPQFSEFDHGERYAKVMAGDQADLTAYFKVKNPFATKQEAIFFKEIIEIAAPFLIKQYHTDPAEIPGLVAKALKNHPVFSNELSPEILRTGNDRLLRIAPVLRDAQGNIQNATLMPSALSAEPPIYVQMTSSQHERSVFPVLNLTWTVQGSVQPSLEPQAVSYVGLDFSASGPLASMLEVTAPGVVAALGLNNPEIVSTGPSATNALEAQRELLPAADQPLQFTSKEVWDFFQPGQGMLAELEKQILMVVPRTAIDMGELGKVVLRFINHVRENSDFTKRNVMARSALQEFKAAMIANNKQYLNAFRGAAQPTSESVDRFGLLRNFLEGLENAELSELDALTPISTTAYRYTVSQKFGRFQVPDAQFSTQLQQTMLEIQDAFGVGFSQKYLASSLPVRDVKVLGYDDAAALSGELAARLWIAAALVRTAIDLSQYSGVDDPQLAALLNDYLGADRPVSVTDRNVVHVQLPSLSAKELDAFIEDFVPVLAAMALTHVSMRLNFMGDSGDVSGIIDAMLARAASKGKVRLPKNGLQGMGARGRTFPSIVVYAKDDGQQYVLGEVETVGRVARGGRNNVSARCVFAQGTDSKTIAAHALTLIQNLLKRQLSDRYTDVHLDTMFPNAFRSAMAVLEKYFAEIAFRASA
jgi:hypothetical protein